MGTSVESPKAGTHRVGDEERQKVAELLADHHAAGRLDEGAFEERLGAALTARTSRELGRLVADLPIAEAEAAEPEEVRAGDSDHGWRITISRRARRRFAAGTMALGGVSLPALGFAVQSMYDSTLVFVGSMVTGVVGLGIGRIVGWRAHRSHVRAGDQARDRA